MLRTTLLAKNTGDLHNVARTLLEWKPWVRVYALQGKMGAGKTTLIKAIGDVLEVEEVVSSPTFALVNEYTTGEGEPFYHFDFYRINKLEEVYDIGYEEYFYSDNYCFIEWPEMVKLLLPESYVLVEIEVDEKEQRIFHFTLMEQQQ